MRSGQNHLARHSERGKKTRQTEEEVGRQHQGMDRPGVRQVSEGNGEKGKMEETGCEIICGAPITLVVKGQMREREIAQIIQHCRNWAQHFNLHLDPSMVLIMINSSSIAQTGHNISTYI